MRTFALDFKSVLFPVWSNRFAPQPPFEKKLRPGASRLYRKQYSKLDTFIQALLRQKTAINN